MPDDWFDWTIGWRGYLRCPYCGRKSDTVWRVVTTAMLPTSQTRMCPGDVASLRMQGYRAEVVR